MMLEHLGEHDAAGAIIKAIETVLESGPKTRDIGGSASTEEVGKATAATIC
jgi:tartrate dehydrogenase/decarboxylase / D-malate dehydrogenase